MPEIELSAGTVEYEDTDGPVLVLLHGLAMNGSLWRGVVADLREDHHCIVPTLPLGGHCRPMHPDADLSIFGMARLVAAFLAELDLNEVTLVGNDWGGAQLLVSEGLDERVGRLVLASCEAFDNYPPGVPGSAVARAASIPGGLYLAFQSLRLRPLRRLPLTWGWMSKRPVPEEVMDCWFRPLQTQGDPPRSSQVRHEHPTKEGVAGVVRTSAYLRPSSTHRLGQGGPRHAPRAWKTTGRAVSAG